MPRQEGNEKPEGNDHEERKTGDSGYLPDMRHENIQDR